MKKLKRCAKNLERANNNRNFVPEKHKIPRNSFSVRMNSTDNPHLFPACFVELPPDCEGRSANFYLAAEEYVAAHCPFELSPSATFLQSGQERSGLEETATAYLFTWQLRPTVVMGRNQVAHQEVDLGFCRREGIEVVRRKSGGGAIFADERNIMTSLITGGGKVEPLFQAYALAVSQALNAMGATTVVSGRNDILLQYERPSSDAEGDPTQLSGKICGNAFYHLAERNIVHGTMLYDTNPRLMQGALHPDLSKLQASGVKSVRSRVALLKDVLPFGVEELRRQLRLRLTNRSIRLTDEDVRQIEEIERGYLAKEYLYGRKADLNTVLKRRIDGVGTLELQLCLHNGCVESLHIAGDFFENDETTAESAFRQAFEGYAFTAKVVRERIAEMHPERSIRNLTAEILAAMLAENENQ